MPTPESSAGLSRSPTDNGDNISGRKLQGMQDTQQANSTKQSGIEKVPRKQLLSIGPNGSSANTIEPENMTDISSQLSDPPDLFGEKFPVAQISFQENAKSSFHAPSTDSVPRESPLPMQSSRQADTFDDS